MALSLFSIKNSFSKRLRFINADIIDDNKIKTQYV